jgi:acyl-homoserine lactone acylase PvdQ
VTTGALVTVTASLAASAALAGTATALPLPALPPVPGITQPPALKPPIFGPFRSVLAGGEGQTVNAVDLAAYQLTGNPPDSFVNQQPLYAGVMPHAATLTPSELDTYYKRTEFGQMAGGIGSVTWPRPGVAIYRDKRFGMAHIYAKERDNLMFAAGYAQAQERLFLMDALRRTAEGRLAGLLGASAAPGDARQLTDQDFSAQELTRQFDSLPQRFGAEGARAHQDMLDYVDGINAYIGDAILNPLLLPAEYAALGALPEHWTVADSAAEAVMLVTQFTVSNGSEEVNSQLRQAFQRRFGSNGLSYFEDLHMAENPDALTVAKVPFPSDNPGPIQPGPNAVPDYQSIRPRNALATGPGAAQAAALRAGLPPWARSLEGLRKSLPPVESNAVMVAGSLSSTGRPLAAMGPQVGYYSPQIFSEYELHGGGIDSEGVVFPGASPFPLIGHGIDFAWSGTSANGDNEDTFVERLCNADGSQPSRASTSYVYKGRCIRFTTRDQSVTTPLSPLSPTATPQTVVYRTLRSVHGPVFAYATVAGAPVALTKAKGVDFHELDSLIPFMRLSENQPTDARSFMNTMGLFPGTENWFYVDNRSVGWQQSGRYELHAPHSDVDLPTWGDGTADWQGFNPATYTFNALPDSQRPQALDPPNGYIISWNNKEAPGWREGPADFSGGPIHHALILERRLLAEAARNGAKVDLTGLTRSVNQSATTDLRSEEDYPWLRQVVGRLTGTDEAMLQLLDDWHAAGDQRLAPAGSNVYTHSAAIALLDAWYPEAVKAAFAPVLGQELFNQVVGSVLSLPNHGFAYDWASQLQKDLRSVLNAPQVGRYAHIYCGGPVTQPVSAAQLADVRARCRSLLIDALERAIASVKARLGPDPAQWKVYATCAQTSPHACDQEVPNTAGAVATPPFPWQDRGTYHQITELSGHR